MNPSSSSSLEPAGPVATSRGRLGALAARLFGIDLRTLALFRIALALTILLDLALRARDLTAHYSDAGILPRAALIGEFGLRIPSFHLMSGSTTLQAILFVLAALLALALLVGWRTRLATIASWVFLLSLQARNVPISTGADVGLRMLLFWSMFLPLGARFSVDAALDRRAQQAPNAYFSLATLALLVQVMSVYVFTALLKTSDAWIPDGTAVYYALHIDYLVTPIGVWLRDLPTLLKGLTYFVWVLELASPLLVFSPWMHVPLRLVALVLLIGMHVGFMLCLEIGIFPVVSITSLLVLLPGWVFDRLGSRLRTPERRRLVIYYDQPCEFCKKVCLLLRTFLLFPETPIRPAQEVPDIHRDLERHNSWVVVDHDGTRHVRWNAVALVFRRSWWAAPLGVLFASRPLARLGEGIYETIARNRGRLGEWSAAVLPYRRQSLQPSMAGNAVLAMLIVLVVMINLKSLGGVFDIRLPSLANEARMALRLQQKWDMFAPAPSRVDGWFVVRGITAGGQVVDVLRGKAGEPVWDRPAALADEYPSYRWRKYMVALKNPDREAYRPYYARYLCRSYNAGRAREARIRTLSIYFNREVIPPGYLPRRTTVELVHEHDCAAPMGPTPEGSEAPAGETDGL